MDLGVLLLDRIIKVLIQGMIFMSMRFSSEGQLQPWRSCAAIQHIRDGYFEALLAALRQDLEVVLLLGEIALHDLYILEIRESKRW